MNTPKQPAIGLRNFNTSPVFAGCLLTPIGQRQEVQIPKSPVADLQAILLEPETFDVGVHARITRELLRLLQSPFHLFQPSKQPAAAAPAG